MTVLPFHVPIAPLRVALGAALIVLAAGAPAAHAQKSTRASGTTAATRVYEWQGRVGAS